MMTLNKFALLPVPYSHPSFVVFHPGGLEREWFVLLAKALTDPTLGLFVQEPLGSGAYGINPTALLAFGGGTRGEQLALQHYYFAGRVFGKVRWTRPFLVFTLPSMHTHSTNRRHHRP